MSTRLHQEHDRIRSAMAEAQVATIIALYDRGKILPETYPPKRRKTIKDILVDVLDMDAIEAGQWLDSFGIEPPNEPRDESEGRPAGLIGQTGRRPGYGSEFGHEGTT